MDKLILAALAFITPIAKSELNNLRDRLNNLSRIVMFSIVINAATLVAVAYLIARNI